MSPKNKSGRGGSSKPLPQQSYKLKTTFDKDVELAKIQAHSEITKLKIADNAKARLQMYCAGFLVFLIILAIVAPEFTSKVPNIPVFGTHEPISILWYIALAPASVLFGVALIPAKFIEKYLPKGKNNQTPALADAEVD